MTIYLEKIGYELAPHSKMTFGFGYGTPEHYEANPTNPVIYHMWKRGEGANLQGGTVKGKIPSDGQPVWAEFQSSQWSRQEQQSAIFKLIARRNRGVVTFDDKSPYNWSLEIETPGGEVHRTDDQFLYQAPEAGYQLALRISHEAGDSDWVREQTIVFYFKTKQGQYGHGDVYISNWEGEAEMFCRMNFVLNPDGSRNLEPKE
jgi:hypothetical protein